MDLHTWRRRSFCIIRDLIFWICTAQLTSPGYQRQRSSAKPWRLTTIQTCAMGPCLGSFKTQPLAGQELGGKQSRPRSAAAPGERRRRAVEEGARRRSRGGGCAYSRCEPSLPPSRVSVVQCAGGSLRWELNLAWRRDDVDASAGATGGLEDGGGMRGERGAGPWQRAASSPVGATGTAAGRVAAAGRRRAPPALFRPRPLRTWGELKRSSMRMVRVSCCFMLLLLHRASALWLRMEGTEGSISSPVSPPEVEGLGCFLG